MLVGQAIRVEATITALLADPQWKGLIVPTRIGVAGFSAGGYVPIKTFDVTADDASLTVTLEAADVVTPAQLRLRTKPLGWNIGEHLKTVCEAGGANAT